MQCVNCQFQNMPGSAVCGRCGTSLGLATATLDVNPPRAGAMRKRVRRALPVRETFYRLRESAARRAAVRAARGGSAAFLVRLAVPSWPQFHAGQRLRGHLCLWLFLGFLVPALLLLGTRAGSVCLGLAYSVHTTAALDAVMLNFADCGPRDRWVRMFSVCAGLGVIVYLPLMSLMGWVAQPHTIERPFGMFSVGDVVLVNTFRKPLPGRVVLYDAPHFDDRGAAGERRHTVYRFGGPAIERVLAGPGDTVRLAGGELTVNGMPSTWRPLGSMPGPDHLSLRVPAECCLILPVAAGILSPGDADVWERASVVPLSDVTGVVYVRNHPLSAWTVVR